MGSAGACVVQLAAEDAEVVFAYQASGEAAAALAAESRRQGPSGPGGPARRPRCGPVQQVVDEIVNQRQRLDILVNSAGIVRDGLLGSMLPEQWLENVLATNLFGTYNYCRAAVQQMMYQRSGAVVNLSSTAAEFASRGQVNYAASKGGIDGLTRAMAKELAPARSASTPWPRG